MKKQSFIQQCQAASAALRQVFPKPQIHHTTDLYAHLQPHEREALRIKELKGIKPTRNECMVQHIDRINRIRNAAIDERNYQLVKKANSILHRWIPIMNTALGSQAN